ncbi:MAG: tetratricopeptide repeat protein [Candidatus Eremiobacteraeota bacterium]|nr:tetratricopeptide repeat protein [Candidatus Eremiobacteraeota bacterium]
MKNGKTFRRKPMVKRIKWNAFFTFLVIAIVLHMFILFALKHITAIKSTLITVYDIKVITKRTKSNPHEKTPESPPMTEGGRPTYTKYGRDPELLTAKKKYMPREIWDAGGIPDLRREADYLKDLVDKKPKNNEIRYLLGLNYFQRELYDDCRDTLEEILKRDPEHERSLETRAYIYLSLNRNEEAIEYAKTGLKHYPDNPRLLYILGSGYLYEENDTKKAGELLERAIKLDPADPLIRIILAENEFAKGTDESIKKGFKILEDTIEKFPDYHLPYFYLAEKYHLYMSDWTNALSLSKTAAGINPQEHRSYLVSGDVYMDKMEYDKALQYYKYALKAVPKVKYLSEVYMKLGDVYLAIGERDDAEEYYLKAISQEEENPEETLEKAQAYLKMAEFLMKQKNYKKAKEYIDRAFEQGDYLETRFLGLAKWYLGTGKPGKAIEAAEKSYDIPNKGDVRLMRDDIELLIAQAYSQKGDRKKAIEHLKTAFKYAPRNLHPKYIKEVEENEFLEPIRKTKEYRDFIEEKK